MIVFRRFRIQGTVFTSGIAYDYPYSQHFKAKSINRKPTSAWRLFPCSHSIHYQSNVTPLMMDDSALKSLFERISSDYSLWKTLVEAIQPPTDATSSSENTQPPGQTDQHTNNVNQVADEHLHDEPLLVADVHQSRGVNG